MKRLRLLPFFLLCGSAIFAQGGGYVSVPVLVNTFTLGPGTSLVTLPDGTQAIEGATFSKDLGVSPSQLQGSVDGIYTFNFTVINHFPSYPGYYHIELDFGTQELCPAEGWGIKAVMHVTVICGGPHYIVVDQKLPGGGSVQGAYNIVINGNNSGWQMDFKDFSVAFRVVP